MWWQCVRRQWPCKSHHTFPCFSHQPQTTSPILSRLQCTVSTSSFSPSLCHSGTHMHLYETSKWWQTQTDDVTGTPCPLRLYASKCRKPVFDPRSLFHACLCTGRGQQHPVREYSTSCLSPLWFNWLSDPGKAEVVCCPLTTPAVWQSQPRRGLL